MQLSHALAIGSIVLAVFGCSAPGGPGSIKDPSWGGTTPSTRDGGASDVPPVVQARCAPAQGHKYPARVNVMSAEVTGPKEATMFTADLFNLFKSHCGACHVDNKLGDFQVRLGTFSTGVDAKVLASMRTDDPAKFMPPPPIGKPFSSRPEGDPVVELVTLLEKWLEQGRPPDAFKLESQVREGVSPYLMSRELGMGMTNLGDCVVEAGPLAGNGARMDELDSFFASAKELPESLEQTDLFTWEGEVLARHSVIAFAPTYPLWSDDAGKIRHIRVPRGQSVAFDKQKQSFSIPPNTRFYKTFLKEVVDAAGNKAYRKLETRLIVSRPDKVDADGKAEVTALFGTYLWNEDESEARLLRDPLRNGEPFRDRLITYTVDEPKLVDVLASDPPDLNFALEKQNKGVVRRYAIPSAQRCMDCHMGSPNASFVLGFIPLQVARRPQGQHGVIEPVTQDELSQLKRLIEYGVISGMTSPEDVLPLEASQGERKPRNQHELVAQGYLLGNCANCHNPRGFPSIKSPELKEVLDFLPSAAGGVFQFPLERVSPLRRRGFDQDVPMPYITPSLREYPVAASNVAGIWDRKWVDCSPGSPEPWYVCEKRSNGLGAGQFVHVDAPWRSLLYRNVDTPYPYADDFVVFPHMPMHVAGFDCRAPRIMGDWMVSIPAVRKSPETFEDALPIPPEIGPSRIPYDRNPQPYVEVKPTDEGYQNALASAERRLKEYHEGGRYEFCPATGDVVLQTSILKPDEEGSNVPSTFGVNDPKDLTKLLMPGIGVPTAPHWIITDLTDPAGDWYPRRPDWKGPLVEKKTVPIKGDDHQKFLQELLVEIFADVRLSEEVKRYATTELPFGLWEAKPGCDLSGEKKVSDFTGDAQPDWMRARNDLMPTAPVYMQSPGAAVYSTVCFNCHGPQADSKGLLSEAIMLMTGGSARVANFRDGLFGPVGKPGENRQRVFANAPMASPGGPPLTADDLGARYTSWMALGGTQQVLPPDLLNIVGITKVLGELRNTRTITITGSANMLQLAFDLCKQLLPVVTNGSVELNFKAGGFELANTALITKNGDAEMWRKLCHLDQPRQVVRVPNADWKSVPPRATQLAAALSFFWADDYPVDADVLDHRGLVVKGVKPDNYFPVCIRKPSAEEDLKVADQWREDNRVRAGGPLVPYCPEILFKPGNALKTDTIEGAGGVVVRPVDGYKWALRGAINAGMSVFSYMDQLSRGGTTVKPAFNKCEELKK